MMLIRLRRGIWFRLPEQQRLLFLRNFNHHISR
jgi:hypothetical protein